MPALPDVPQVLRYDMAHTFSADPHLTSRFFMKYSGSAPSNGDLDSAAAGVVSTWTGRLQTLCNENITLVSVTVTDLTTPSSAQGSATASVGGTRAGQAMTINDCAVLNFQIARRYRGGKPRMYGPWGVTGDQATASTFSSGFVTAVNTEWANFISVIQTTYGSTTVGDQVNVSYYHGFASVQNPVTLRWRNIPTPRATAVIDVINSHACSNIIGSQRRRIRA